MSKNTERGARSERGSALWGTGSRGGDRSSVLWGKGGRGIVLTCVAVFALAAPLAAMAKSKPIVPVTTTTTTTPVAPAAPVVAAPSSSSSTNTPDGKTWVAKGLLDKAKSAPNDLVDVIIQSSGDSKLADKVVAFAQRLSSAGGDNRGFNDKASLGLVNAVSVSLPAKIIPYLSTIKGLTVTPDSIVKVSATPLAVLAKLSSTQLWPYESGNAAIWPGDQTMYAGKTPTIAIVDSGIQNRADFGSRLLANVNLSTIAGNVGTDDQRGHGTFVAGIAAGSSPDLTGADPVAPLVGIKVMNDQGMAKTSDVIAACQWILDHKAQYNIRVANFSLHSSYSTNFYRDPLDQAVEKLWFGGVVVVAAAGNYGTASGPSGVLYAPGNDPFVITVGAIDLGNSIRANDDTVAPWSAYGYTHDGFYKPDVSAPGRYMVGPIPAGSTLTVQKAANLVGTDRIQLSGTSFSAPVVSGTVAQMLARHPNWTPDQVKGVLMRTARKVTVGNPKAAGLGEITATRAVTATYAPNPNLGLDKFVTPVSGGSGVAFDAMSWANAAKSDMSWNSMSWTDQSWSDQSWSDQSWATMSWTDMSWTDMSWTDMSWTDMSWTDMSNEDAAEGDSLSGDAGYTADSADVIAAATDPDTAVPVDGLDPLTALGVTAVAPAPVAAVTAAAAPVTAAAAPVTAAAAPVTAAATDTAATVTTAVAPATSLLP